jgi:hypothetical protein
MHVGETCEITAPSDFGYGKQAHGIVPGDSTLIFVIKCLSFSGAEVAPGVFKLPQDEAQPMLDQFCPQPEEDSWVSLSFRVRAAPSADFMVAPGEVLQQWTTVTGFLYDEAFASWPPLVSIVRLMRMGERSRFRLEHDQRWCEVAITVEEVRTVSRMDHGVRRLLITHGPSWESPVVGGRVVADATFSAEGMEKVERHLDFELGKGVHSDALEDALVTMKVGETAEVFGVQGKLFEPAVWVDATVPLPERYRVRVHVISAEAPEGAPVDLAERAKDRGNALVAAGKYERARDAYALAVDLPIEKWKDDKPLLARALTVHLAALKNVALCHLKEKSFADSIEICKRVLKFAPCEKTMRRLCEAYTGYGLYADAISGWEEIRKMNPDCDEEAEKKIAQLAKRQKASASKNKDFMKSMFKSSFDPAARA